MATFSVNQSRQFYVGKEKVSAPLTSKNNPGAILVCADKNKTHLYFQHMGLGGITRSDLIDIKNIISATATDADSMAHKQIRYKLTLNAEVNGGTPIAGQDYITKIAILNYIGLSEEDQTYKFGVVHAYTDMTASDFYKKMIMSLLNNFTKEESEMLNFYLETGGSAPETEGTPVLVTKGTKESTLVGEYTGIIIEEAVQDWILGTMPETYVNFSVHPDTVTIQGSESIWGEVHSVTPKNVINNGRVMADMEYFYMGERGDQYRMHGFPYVIRTNYMITPFDSKNAISKYNTIDIHYSYIGSNESVQKSERTITIAIPKVGEANSTSNVLTNDIIKEINKVAGIKIAELSVL